MVWVYDDPPYTEREKRAYSSLIRKTKDKQFIDKLIKLISLYVYLKRTNFTSIKQIETSAYFDKAKTKPIFNKKIANKILRALNQKGGESRYPYTNEVVNRLLYDLTPTSIGTPVSTVFKGVTGTVDTLKNNIPFADLVLEAVHSTSSIGVTTAGDVGELLGGPIGAAVVAPFTAIVAALTATLSTIEGDLGGAVVHIANWVPAIGSALGKIIEKGEHMAVALQKHPNIASLIPYMTQYHDSLKKPPVTAGKRLSTMRYRERKWPKTQRRK